MKINYALCLVTDNEISVKKILNRFKNGVEPGITAVQLRMKNSGIKEVMQTARKLIKVLTPLKIPLIINDYIEAVKITGAAGVHIGQRDVPYQQARDYLGKDSIIGLSIENEAQAEACCHFDADYFGAGPVFITHTKLDAPPPIGIVQLQNIVTLFSKISKPVVAIGGIHEKNIRQIVQTGVAGVAVASAILFADYPRRVISKLREQAL
jgi:thiamine-phosphate pyrophosphorylase